MESEANLPHATIKQLILKNVSPNYKSSAAGITNLISELAQDFISVVSELAHAECLNSGKKTIMPEHVTSALKKNGFPINDSEIEQFMQDLNKIKAAKPKEQLKLKMHGMSDEQLIEEQGKLFESAGKQTNELVSEKQLDEDLENYD